MTNSTFSSGHRMLCYDDINKSPTYFDRMVSHYPIWSTKHLSFFPLILILRVLPRTKKSISLDLPYFSQQTTSSVDIIRLNSIN